MLLYTTLLTIILAVILAGYNFKLNRTSLYLSIYLVTQAMYGLAHYAVVYSNSADWIAVLYVNFAPLSFLAGPCLYFYIRGTLTDQYRIRPKEWLHFVPALINLAGILPYLFSSYSHKLETAQLILSDLHNMKTLEVNWILPTGYFSAARVFQLFCYTVISGYLIGKHTLPSNARQYPIIQQKLVIRWLYALTIISLTISICSVITLYAFLTVDGPSVKAVVTEMPYINIGGIAYFLIPLMLLVFPQVIYGIPVLNSSVETTPSDKKVEKMEMGKAKERKPDFENQEPFRELATRIVHYMEKEKPYLDPYFNIDSIVTHLDIPKHHVYYCFNAVMQTKFTHMRARMRVEHAMELLRSPEASLLTMEGIGSESGFHSRSVFFATFKELTGITPKEFVEQQQTDEK